jgi:type I restriction enzyme S subunit
MNGSNGSTAAAASGAGLGTNRPAGFAAGLRPYPKMKDFGVPWLGEVPEHWEVQTVGRLGQLFKGNGASKADEVAVGVPCVRNGDLYTRHEFFITKTKACVAPDRATAYTPIRFGDLLFAASGETDEDIGRSAVNLLRTDARCGGDVLVLRPSPPAATSNSSICGQVKFPQ